MRVDGADVGLAGERKDRGTQGVGVGDAARAGLTVWYDGACPLCRREMAVYRGLPARAPVCFADVSDAAQPWPPGPTREQWLARLHVRDADGRLLSGAQAFLALWAALPGWRWLARAGRLPGLPWVMERAYRLFLRLRPVLQRWALRLDRPARAAGRRRAGADTALTACGPLVTYEKESGMTEDPRCCGSGTCIIDAEGRCWCGQRWDGQKMCHVPLASAEQRAGSDPAPAARPSAEGAA